MAAAMSTVSVMMTLKIRQSLKDNNNAAEASTLGSLNTRSSTESSADAAATTNDNNSLRSGDID